MGPDRALLLSGGGGLVPYHIGATQVLTGSGRRYDVVGGTSIGAFVAAFLAQFTVNDQHRAALALGKVFEDLPELDTECITCRLACLFGATSWSARGVWGGALSEFVSKHLSFAKVQSSGIKLVINATDGETMAPVYYITESFAAATNRGDIVIPSDSSGAPPEVRIMTTPAIFSDAVSASMSVPFAFNAVMSNGRRILDGALVQGLPRLCLPRHCVDAVVCLPCNSGFRMRRPLPVPMAAAAQLLAIQSDLAVHDHEKIMACSSACETTPGVLIQPEWTRAEQAAYELEPFWGMVAPQPGKVSALHSKGWRDAEAALTHWQAPVPLRI